MILGLSFALVCALGTNLSSLFKARGAAAIPRPRVLPLGSQRQASLPAGSEEAVHGCRRYRGEAAKGGWHRSRARQQTLSVRRDICREIKTIALHLKVILLRRARQASQTPESLLNPTFRRPDPGRALTLLQDPG